jgi:hypothetical protein
MIHTELTKKFFGIHLYGDFNDLERLHKVIHHCADGYAENSGARDHLHFVAYEIRHAKQGERNRKASGGNEDDKIIYYGTSFTLPYYLLFINLMQNSFVIERRLWQTALIWELTADLQETALTSGSTDFVQCVDYWAFNTLLNQPRLIPGQQLLSAMRDKDYLTVMADFATIKFKSLLPEDRLIKLSTVMNYMHPYTDDHKEGVNELKKWEFLLSKGVT